MSALDTKRGKREQRQENRKPELRDIDEVQVKKEVQMSMLKIRRERQKKKKMKI